MNRERLVIVGAGLCGSLLAARLRQRFEVVVVEPRRTPRPLTDEIACETGAVNSTINRASGLGGTTNYWHNALIELDRRDLLACGLVPEEMRQWYDAAWKLFLDRDHRAVVQDWAAAAGGPMEGFTGTCAQMVVPQKRSNMWSLAQRRFPGDPLQVIESRVRSLQRLDTSGRVRVSLEGGAAGDHIDADRVIVCAGGLGSPVILARTFSRFGVVNGGYHDHPMAYVAKIRLRPGSPLRLRSGIDREGMSLRTGFVHEHDGIKAGIYLRPALGLGIRSITGEARYILSDLRNDPFSPRKILQLLMNPEAIREALLFKTGAGLRGEHFSLLLLGEQHPEPSRGVRVEQVGRPALNWSVTPRERAAYAASLQSFLSDFGAQIVAQNVIPAADWEFRTAAHHSGGISHFQSGGDDTFAVAGWPTVAVCDGSVLRAGGIANSGLTLAALALRLADRLDPAGSHYLEEIGAG